MHGTNHGFLYTHKRSGKAPCMETKICQVSNYTTDNKTMTGAIMN